MAKAAADNNDPAKMFSADVVAAVLTASGITSLSMKQYEMMSALDGTRTANGFQHAFRSVLAKSKELKARVEGGEVFEPVPPSNKRTATSAKASPATPRKRKTASAGNEDTPSKKRATLNKTTKSPDDDVGNGNKDDTDSGNANGNNGLPEDMDEFIKREQEWEKDYV